MKVLSVLEDAELIIADLEVNLGDETPFIADACAFAIRAASSR